MLGVVFLTPAHPSIHPSIQPSNLSPTQSSLVSRSQSYRPKHLSSPTPPLFLLSPVPFNWNTTRQSEKWTQTGRCCIMDQLTVWNSLGFLRLKEKREGEKKTKKKTTWIYPGGDAEVKVWCIWVCRPSSVMAQRMFTPLVFFIFRHGCNYSVLSPRLLREENNPSGNLLSGFSNKNQQRSLWLHENRKH